MNVYQNYWLTAVRGHLDYLSQLKAIQRTDMENTRANYEGSLDLGFWSINAQTDVTDWNTPVQGITDVELEQAGVALSPMETPMSEYKGVDRAINLIIDELYAARF